MPKYVAFLRAINVGGHTVKMDQLRNLFVELDFENVETFIASGNVVFDCRSKNSQSLERKIEKHLQQALGYAVLAFVRSVAQVHEIAAYMPFDEVNLETDSVYIGFVGKALEPDTIRKFVGFSNEVDVFHVRGSELFWLCRGKISDSKFFGPGLEKTLGQPATLRNSNTVRRIAAKYS